ncbi:hypothetical protein PDG61_09260 [Mycolicibacterium sp. BiH015]|uniref:hypothetical protein n=1 Tax=Mycolicibacterium sp. BiH015 TaxID=3018808 RepID=UPI0022E88487|nr:hypothetical protein [Mycolicibacterium sp. BiH015]MDA2891099.1 hypothetical protein [Mycolicibacterium sp. BiH015]
MGAFAGIDDSVPSGTLFTVNGTGVADPFGASVPADLARALVQRAEGMWNWQPVGYPAAAFPMGPSVHVGRAALCAQIRRHPGPVALSGYGQGALIVSTVWRDDLLAADGVLHDRLADVAAIVNFGDPMRCPGLANGNAFAGAPLPRNIDGFVSGGIAGPGNLTPEQTPDFLLSFANDADLYTCAPTGPDPWNDETDVGYNERIVFDILQAATVTRVSTIAAEVAETLNQPVEQIVPMVRSIAGGAFFLGAGVGGPHARYDFTPAVRFLTEVGANLRVRALIDAAMPPAL